MVLEKILKIIADAAFEKGASKFDKIKNKYKWINIFKNVGKEVSHQFEMDNADSSANDIILFLTSSEITEIAKVLYDNREIDLYIHLEEELNNHMQLREISLDLQNGITEKFQECLVSYLLDEFSDVVKKNAESLKINHINESTEKIGAIVNDIPSIKDDTQIIRKLVEETNINKNFSITQIEKELSHIFPSDRKVDLSFYEIDDQSFLEIFDRCFESSNIIHIKGNTLEETLYGILYHLRKKYSDFTVVVVQSEEGWKRHISEDNGANDKNRDDLIYIPYFKADEVLPMPFGKTIFITDDKNTYDPIDYLMLRKQTRDTRRKKLINAGYSEREASEILLNSAGNYLSIKRRMTQGSVKSTFNTMMPDSEDKRMLFAMLCAGGWCQNSKDMEFLELLAQKDYEEIQSCALRYSGTTEEVIAVKNMHGNCHYQVTDSVSLWNWLGGAVVNKQVWNRYLDLMKKIAVSEDRSLTLSMKDSYAGIFTSNNERYSRDLLENCMKALRISTSGEFAVGKTTLNSFVSGILQEIDTPLKWASLMGISDDLCVIAPDVMLETLEHCLDHPDSALYQLLTDDNNKTILKRCASYNLYMAIEQIMTDRQYFTRGFDILANMYHLTNESEEDHYLRSSLERIIYPISYLRVISFREKLILVKKAFGKGVDIWNIVFKCTDPNPGIAFPIDEDIIVFDENYNINDVRYMWDQYLLLSLEYMNGSSERWRKVLIQISRLSRDRRETVYLALMKDLPAMSDPEKAEIKEDIRRYIFKKRYFGKGANVMNDADIDRLEEVMRDIQTNDPVWDYRYLFTGDYFFPLLHPKKYHSNDRENQNDAENINFNMAKEEKCSRLITFREKNLDIRKLIRICSELPQTDLGKYLFTCWSEHVVDLELLQILVENDQSKEHVILLGYIEEAYLYDGHNIYGIIQKLKELDISEDIITQVTRIAIKNIDVDSDIFSLTPFEKHKLWNANILPTHQHDKKLYIKILGEIIHYGNQQVFILELNRARDLLSPEELLFYLEQLDYVKPSQENEMINYYFINVLGIVQDAFMDTEKYGKVAMIERRNKDRFSEYEDMRCMLRSFEMSSTPYINMIKAVSKKYKEKAGCYISQEESSEYFSFLYSDFSFSPGFINDHIDKIRLNTWVTQFRNGMIENGMEDLFTEFLGYAFAAEMKEDDGITPVEPVREMIEIYGDKQFISAYNMKIYNGFGCRILDAGESERSIAKKYEAAAKSLDILYPKTAMILRNMEKLMQSEYQEERISAE